MAQQKGDLKITLGKTQPRLSMKRGLLLINLGTPIKADRKHVGAFLRDFLMDRRVIDLPYFLRYLLVSLLIVPFRTKKTVEAYQAIWSSNGSPLQVKSQILLEQLQDLLKEKYTVVLGMRYGKPSLSQALFDLKECDSITILPLYPQYSSAATGSALEETLKIISHFEMIPFTTIIRDFYQHPDYIKAQAQIIKQHLAHDTYLLLSYHGIPTRQNRKIHENGVCYQSQCYQTSHLLAEALELSSDQYSTAFQSRLGNTAWIKPYTTETLIDLAQQGIKNLAIACPSFVTDCLETLEEIGIQAKKQWFELGGKEFSLIPCMNDNPLWLTALVNMIDGR